MEKSIGTEEFIIKLFDQVKESSDKNSESIDKLSSAIIELVKESNFTLKQEEEIYKLIKEHVKETRIIFSDVNLFMERINKCLIENKKAFEDINIKTSDVNKLEESTVEIVNSVRWLKGKVKIFIAIISFFAVITGLSYTVVKYSNESQTVHEIQKVIEKETNKIMNVIKKLHPEDFNK